MPLESGSYVNDLAITNPTSGDPKSQGDDHFRLIKSVLKVTFSGFLGAVVVRGPESGTGAAYVVTPSTAIPSLQVGMRVQFITTNANTGPATLTVSALAPTPLVHANGSALVAGDLPAGRISEAIYDGTSFQLVGGPSFVSKTGNQTINGGLTLVGGGLTSNGVATFTGLGASSFGGGATFGGGITATGPLTLLGATGNITAQGTGTNTLNAGRTLVKSLPFGTPNSDDAVSVQMLNQASFSSVLPAQTTDGPRFLRTAGGVTSWEFTNVDIPLQSLGIY